MAILHRGQLRAFGRPDELAAELWRGTPVELDLGSAADERTLAALRTGRGVVSADPTASGARRQRFCGWTGPSATARSSASER